MRAQSQKSLERIMGPMKTRAVSSSAKPISRPAIPFLRGQNPESTNNAPLISKHVRADNSNNNLEKKKAIALFNAEKKIKISRAAHKTCGSRDKNGNYNGSKNRAIKGNTSYPGSLYAPTLD